MENSPEQKKNAAVERADLDSAEAWLRTNLEGCLPLEEILEHLRNLRERSRRGEGAPHAIAESIVENFYRRLDN